MNYTRHTARPKEQMNAPHFEVYFYENFPETDLVAHYHEFYEIHMVLDGEVSYWVDGAVYPMKPGNILLLQPMQLHKPALTEMASCQRIVLWLNKQYLENDLHSGSLAQCFSNGCRLYFAPHLTESFQKLFQEMQSVHFASDIYVQTLISQILIQISRINVHKTQMQTASPLIADIISYISQHYTENICLSDIANHFHISKFYLSHLFKTETGTSVYHFIVIKRLALAKQLLISGHSANQVYTMCGFRDYSVFYKAFKSEYHVSPNDI